MTYKVRGKYSEIPAFLHSKTQIQFFVQLRSPQKNLYLQPVFRVIQIKIQIALNSF